MPAVYEFTTGLAFLFLRFLRRFLRTAPEAEAASGEAVPADFPVPMGVSIADGDLRASRET